MIKFRQHFLVIGATGTGKGVTVTKSAREWLDSAPHMLVYFLTKKKDEYEDFFPGHPRVFKTMDQARLLEEVQKLQARKKGYVHVMVIIDEAWAWKWKGKGGLEEIPNAARSYGVELWVQSQFPSQMAPTVRANCRNRFVFTLDEPAALEWVTNCLGREFKNCASLPVGRYIAKYGLDKPFYGTAWYEDENGKWCGV